jgi:hypothetical protein
MHLKGAISIIISRELFQRTETGFPSAGCHIKTLSFRRNDCTSGSGTSIVVQDYEFSRIG